MSETTPNSVVDSPNSEMTPLQVIRKNEIAFRTFDQSYVSSLCKIDQKRIHKLRKSVFPAEVQNIILHFLYVKPSTVFWRPHELTAFIVTRSSQYYVWCNWIHIATTSLLNSQKCHSQGEVMMRMGEMPLSEWEKLNVITNTVEPYGDSQAFVSRFKLHYIKLPAKRNSLFIKNNGDKFRPIEKLPSLFEQYKRKDNMWQITHDVEHSYSLEDLDQKLYENRKAEEEEKLRLDEIAANYINGYFGN